jgi:hypothetical protein
MAKIELERSLQDSWSPEPWMNGNRNGGAASQRGVDDRFDVEVQLAFSLALHTVGGPPRDPCFSLPEQATS